MKVFEQMRQMCLGDVVRCRIFMWCSILFFSKNFWSHRSQLYNFSNFEQHFLRCFVKVSTDVSIFPQTQGTWGFVLCSSAQWTFNIWIPPNSRLQIWQMQLKRIQVLSSVTTFKNLKTYRKVCGFLRTLESTRLNFLFLIRFSIILLISIFAVLLLILSQSFSRKSSSVKISSLLISAEIFLFISSSITDFFLFLFNACIAICSKLSLRLSCFGSWDWFMRGKYDSLIFSLNWSLGKESC